MTKREELSNPESCLNKAADDEPIFVLRAKDMLSPLAIEAWAEAAEDYGVPKDKIAEARALAARMSEWPDRKVPD